MSTSTRKSRLSFIVPANAVISGRIVDGNNEPAVDAFVWLLKSSFQRGALKETVIGPKVTAEDGLYSFDTGLEANRRYYVVVDRPPPDELIPAAAADLTDRQPIEVPTYFPSATRMESATPVILQPGENRQVDIKIATAPFYCVEGKIQISGKPAPADFAIQETPLAGSRLARVRNYASSDGKYHVCGISPGSYRLSTQEDFTEFSIANGDLRHVDLSMDTAYPKLQVDWDGATTPEFPTLNAQGEATLRKLAGFMGLGDAPSDDELKKLAMNIQKPDFANTVSVQTTADAMTKMQAEPDFASQMGNLMSQLRPMGSMLNVTLVGIGNSFVGPIRNSVPSGEYTVDVFSPIDSYPKEMTFNDLKLADGIVRIPPAATGTLHVLMARGPATLSAAVADSDGKPVPNATVVVIPDSVTTVPALSRIVTHGKTDQNGNYSVRSLPPGKYRVLATPQSVRWDVPEDLEKVLLVMFQAKDIELESKATLQITLGPVPI